jgi:hypothetical protein
VEAVRREAERAAVIDVGRVGVLGVEQQAALGIVVLLQHEAGLAADFVQRLPESDVDEVERDERRRPTALKIDPVAGLFRQVRQGVLDRRLVARQADSLRREQQVALRVGDELAEPLPDFRVRMAEGLSHGRDGVGAAGHERLPGRLADFEVAMTELLDQLLGRRGRGVRGVPDGRQGQRQAYREAQSESHQISSLRDKFQRPLSISERQTR